MEKYAAQCLTHGLIKIVDSPTEGLALFEDHRQGEEEDCTGFTVTSAKPFRWTLEKLEEKEAVEGM